MRPQLTRFRGWKVESVEPGDHGWRITVIGPNGEKGYIDTGHTPIKDNVIKQIVGKRVGTLVMDSQNTRLHFDDQPIVWNALDYRISVEDEEPYNPQWPEEREAIGEHPPALGDK